MLSSTVLQPQDPPSTSPIDLLTPSLRHAEIIVEECALRKRKTILRNRGQRRAEGRRPGAPNCARLQNSHSSIRPQAPKTFRLDRTVDDYFQSLTRDSNRTVFRLAPARKANRRRKDSNTSFVLKSLITNGDGGKKAKNGSGLGSGLMIQPSKDKLNRDTLRLTLAVCH